MITHYPSILLKRICSLDEPANQISAQNYVYCKYFQKDIAYGKNAAEGYTGMWNAEN